MQIAEILAAQHMNNVAAMRAVCSQWKQCLDFAPVSLCPLGLNTFFHRFHRITSIDYSVKGAGPSLHQDELIELCQAGSTIVSLNLTGSFQLTCLEALTALTDLQKLVLDTCSITVDDLQVILPKLGLLRYLSLRGCAFLRSEVLSLLTSAPCAKTLRWLNLSDCELALHLNTRHCKSFPRLTALEGLSVGGNTVSDAVLEYVSQIPALRYLSICRSTEVTDFGVDALSMGPVHKNIHTLDLRGCPNLTPHSFDSLVRFTKLADLRLPGHVLCTPAVDGQAASLWRLDRMKVLTVHEDAVHPSWLKIISATCGPHLVSLDLSLPSAGHSALHGRRGHFARLAPHQRRSLMDAARSFHNLVYLNLSNSGMPLEVVGLFMKTSTKLETLNLSGCTLAAVLSRRRGPLWMDGKSLWRSSGSYTPEVGDGTISVLHEYAPHSLLGKAMECSNGLEDFHHEPYTWMDTFARALGRLENLRVVMMRSSGLEDSHLRHLVSLKKLEVVDLSGNRNITDAALLCIQPSIHTLRELNLSGTSIRDIHSLTRTEKRNPNEKFDPSCHIVALERLNLSSCRQLQCASLKTFIASIASRGRSGLRCINLSDCTGVNDEVISDVLDKAPEVIELSLAGCNALTPEAMVQISSLTKLQCLDVSRCNSLITDDSILHLCCQVPHLTKLSLGGASLLTQDGLTSALKKLHSLAELDLTCVRNIGTDDDLDVVVPQTLPAMVDLPSGGKMPRRGSPLKRMNTNLLRTAPLEELVL